MPLPIPVVVWTDILMDFITNMSKVKRQTVIFVVVNRLSKYAHFSPLPTNCNVSMVVEAFTSMMIKLHGIPNSIVSDRDRVFTSKFWREIHRLGGTGLHFPSAYLVHSNGRTDVVNKTLEMYLRSYCHEDPKNWLKVLHGQNCGRVLATTCPLA